MKIDFANGLQLDRTWHMHGPIQQLVKFSDMGETLSNKHLIFPFPLNNHNL